MNISNHPKISVCVITFNHAELIGKALDSILMQQTTFDYEIVVGDDCSTDGTPEIIRSYQKRWPEKINYLARPSNLGMGKNFHQTLTACKGAYIAILEGDDYWTDPEKLQLQGEFMERHSDCVLCHHPVEHISWPEGKVLKQFPPAQYRHQRPTHQTLAMFNFIQTCSVMFRRDCLPPLDEQFELLKLADWPLFVLLAQRGWIGYLDRCMAHYRIHPSNTWNHRPADYKVQAMEAMARYLMERVDRGSKELWEDTILALAFKDLLIAVRALSITRAVQKVWRFIGRSREFKRPLWLVTRLWSYWSVYRC